MTENKHIDRLFQERFKDFEAQPDPKVWEDIEKSLMEKKNKKRILPLWFRIAGAAAVLAGLIFLGISITENETNTPNQKNDIIITDTDKTSEQNNNNTDTSSEKINDNSDKKFKLNNEKSIITQSNNNKKDKNIVNDIKVNNNTDDKNMANDALVNKDNVVNQNRETIKNTPVSADSAIVFNRLENIKKQKVNRKVKTDAIPNQNINNTDKVLISERENHQKKNLLEELPQLNKNNETIRNKNKKWTVGSVIAPIYFNSLSDGSPISPALKNNAKSGNNTLAYGVKINYRISDKFSIQSGINTVDLSYTTKNVAPVIASLSGSENINILTNSGKSSLTFVSTLQKTASDAYGFRTSYDVFGKLEQKYGYIEIPLEAKYNLIEKVIGINLVGGFSTYFLNDNELVITSFGQRSQVGEANNLNNVNFSGNLGIDFDYNLNKKIFINISPMMKYQFNTFSKNSGGFKPYYFGIYSGLNFRF
ncbi:MAG: hypothetical protein CSA39_02625 [Flavobacteriales bacterium]|nr:MAG: hypothetical protein CSA39_02625 [Flavobacteriales bacterium]